MTGATVLGTVIMAVAIGIGVYMIGKVIVNGLSKSKPDYFSDNKP